MAQEPVTVQRYRDLPEAMVAQGMLASAGIDSYLRDENTIRMDWMWSQAMGGVRLEVAEEDAEAALELLAAPIPESYSAEDVGEAFTQPRCPVCGSLDVRHPGINKMLSYALMWLGMPFPVPSKSWHCETCRAEWVEE
jgi:hypothetical protein